MIQNRSLELDEFPLISSSGWEFKVRQELKGDDFSTRMHSESWDQLALRPLYKADDLRGSSQLAGASPGDAPYLRGASSYPGNCDRRLDISTSDVDEANRLARMALARGISSLCFYARINDQRIRGVAISQQSDMARLLAGIDLTQTKIYFDWGLHAPVIVALLLNEAARQGVSPKTIHGGLLFDPIAEMLPAGSYCGRSENLHKRLFRLHTALSSEFSKNFHPLTIKGHPYHNAGASGVQEIAYAMSAAVEYIDQLTEQGVALENLLADIRFSFSIGPHLIPEIAKFRAARLLWASISRRYTQEGTPLSGCCHIHARSGRVNKEALAPKWNIPRSTLEALAAMSGGCDAISVIPYNEAAGEPVERAYASSCAIPDILQHEAQLGKILDPFGGSYAVESLSITIAEQALELFLRIEKEGGLIAAIGSGQLQRDIGKIRHFKEKQLACSHESLVGLNFLPTDETRSPVNGKKEIPLPRTVDENSTLMIDPYAVEQLQYALREGLGLADITGIAYRSEESFKFEPLRPFRAAGPFEKMRDASAQAAKERGKSIKALLIYEHESVESPLIASRRQTVRQVMAVCGFHLDESSMALRQADEEIYQQAGEADIVILAAQDDNYPIMAKDIFSELNRAHPCILKMVAGYPMTSVETLRSFGTEDFIHAKTHLVEFYVRHARRLGVTV